MRDRGVSHAAPREVANPSVQPLVPSPIHTHGSPYNNNNSNNNSNKNGKNNNNYDSNNGYNDNSNRNNNNNFNNGNNSNNKPSGPGDRYNNHGAMSPDPPAAAAISVREYDDLSSLCERLLAEQQSLRTQVQTQAAIIQVG